MVSASPQVALRPITGTTRLMAMIGDPIAQAKTPSAINPLFAALGQEVNCVPMRVSAADLPQFWAGLKSCQNLIGMGVTLPHKQAAAELCDRLDPLAAALGVANVVRREADGALCGYQFDGRGFLRGLLGQGHQVKGREVTMLGAGGAAVAIAHALAEAGAAKITILNRTLSKATALADLVNGLIGKEICHSAAELPPLASTGIVVNATSLGLHPNDPLPMDAALLAPGMLVAEVIASPEITPLLAAAQGRGADIHSGLHMIHGQVGLIAEHLASAGTVDGELK